MTYYSNDALENHFNELALDYKTFKFSWTFLIWYMQNFCFIAFAFQSSLVRLYYNFCVLSFKIETFLRLDIKLTWLAFKMNAATLSNSFTSGTCVNKLAALVMMSLFKSNFLTTTCGTFARYNLPKACDECHFLIFAVFFQNEKRRRDVSLNWIKKFIKVFVAGKKSFKSILTRSRRASHRLSFL